MTKTTAVATLYNKGPVVEGQAALTFTADYNDERNKDWAKYTPALTVNMTVIDSVAAQFEQGGRYLLTFERAETTRADIPEGFEPAENSFAKNHAMDALEAELERQGVEVYSDNDEGGIDLINLADSVVEKLIASGVVIPEDLSNPHATS